MAMIPNQSYKMFQRPSHEQDFMLFPDSSAQASYTPPMDMSMSPNGWGFSRSPPGNTHPSFEHGPSHPDMNAFMYRGRTSPGLYPDDGELRIPPSNISTASAPSPSSTVGSPNSNHGQSAYMPEYPPSGMNVNPTIVGSGDYFGGTEYSAFTGPGMEEFTTMTFDSKSTFVGELARISTAAITCSACSFHCFPFYRSTCNQPALVDLGTSPRHGDAGWLQVAGVTIILAPAVALTLWP